MLIISAAQNSNLIKEPQITGNLLQTEQWGRFKTEGSWSYDYCLIHDDSGSEVGYFLALFRKTPFGTLIYLPHGPVIYDWEALDIASFKKCMLEYAKSNKGIDIKTDPLLIRNLTDPFEGQTHMDFADGITEKLKSAGFSHNGYTLGFDAGTQPRFQAVIYKDNYYKGNKKLNQYCRIASRRGVNVEIYSGSNLNQAIKPFFNVLHKTEERKNIHLRTEGYFQAMADTLDNVEIYLGRIDLDEISENNEKEIREISAQLESAASRKREHMLKEKLESLEKERSALKAAYEKCETSKPYVSCALTVGYGDTSELLYAGFDETFKYFQPAYLTWNTAVEHCFENGMEKVNLGGLSGYDDDPLLGFKKVFNPTIEEYIGEFDLCTDRLRFFLFNTALRLYKTIRR